jgi:hypothetical protein
MMERTRAFLTAAVVKGKATDAQKMVRDEAQ